MADWGVVCLLAIYCGPNSLLAGAIGCHYLAPRYYSQLLFPRLYSAPATVRL